MPAIWLTLAVLALATAGYVLGRARALTSAGGDSRKLHSLPSYYGIHVFLFTAAPALALLALWILVQPLIIERAVSTHLPERVFSGNADRGLVMSDVRRVANGLDLAVSQGAMTTEYARTVRTELTDVRERLGEVGVAVGSDIGPEVLRAAQNYRSLAARGDLLRSLTIAVLALGGLLVSIIRTTRDFRARNVVEQAILGLLLLSATIAILTTIGIVFSLIFNTVEFFGLYPAWDFFLGLTWSPSFGGGSELGIFPLLWGTFYISLIALAVSVPIGLFAAVYLSEYASPHVRSVAKPLIEVLAGIPTIVYGLFALLTVGPLLMRVFGDGGVGIMQAGTAVMTAGLVMGIMLIPFVSSLSDDIINAVPQAMRDGSLGLGATRSETVRQVVLPAALPGIVGAILLAASRAIGETMIVVMGAGAAARLSMNPFDAMTTVTAKIVSQLTGDADFASPEALVAFALGMTLFVITLGLNVLALYIVRRYREQYE
ncbi:phosphate ABC transporter membrane protein 1 (PhoT family) [Rhodovulum imhoffii]|uniref:Phosphate transport system permease protein n=1 Tax=Rhodovulum imhoffii TaxID=365340 RepID=A0A2T5BTQ7_9RHOB|nr:phosphate ABC transporter permease subunit PstC [Rhodovulum imhoffii]MBK5934124.1 phosphate ABC transporter permease subunit PstC [Rhodovulum imhoffii]PTN02803.1 phosphate ABC transporter membrane protein 1 (PhoT family) [Rhodovulum imhoffii]